MRGLAAENDTPREALDAISAQADDAIDHVGDLPATLSR